MCKIKVVLSFVKYPILISLLILLSLESLHGQQFRNYLELGHFNEFMSADSALMSSKIAYYSAIKEKDTANVIQNLLVLSASNRAMQDYSAAFDHSGEALFLAEQYNNDLLLAKAHEEMGVLYYLFVHNDMAGEHFKQSYTFYMKERVKGNLDKKELFYAYYNRVLYFNRVNNFEKAYAFIDSCELVVDITDSEKLYSIYLDEKRSILNSRQGNNAIALNYLHVSVKKVTRVNPNSSYYRKHHSFLIVLYTSIANIYEKQNKALEAKKYFEKALVIKDYFSEHTFYNAFLYEEYAILLTKMNQYKNAYLYLSKANDIKDKYLNPRKSTAQGFLEVKNRYSEELDKQAKKIGLQQLELAQNKQRILRLRILFILVLFLIATGGLVIRNRMQFFKHQKENALNEKQKLHSEEMLNHKNKELTVTMLQLIEKEEIIKNLSTRLTEVSNNRTTKTFISTINKQSTNLWDAFNNRFVEQNEGFYDRLREKVPDLSSADLKVCALIKLNFNGKEMAQLLGISLGSVHVARHRLRKKMQIERDKNLTQFINSI